jgi:hypothetical protein
MNSFAFTNIVWWGSLGLELGIAFALVYRRMHRELPIFFSYTVFLAARTILLLALGLGSTAYFWAYWGGEVVSWALALAAIQEIGQHLFKPYPAVERLIAVLFRWGAGLLIFIAIFVAYAAPGTDTARVMQGVVALERSVRIVQVGLLSLLFVLAGFLRLRWPHYVFGIALGFGVFCSVELAAITLRAHTGMMGHSIFAILKPVAFVVAQGVWVYCLAVPERARAAAAPEAEPQMEGWNVALLELLRR